jgi:hypothetical protein
MIYTNTASTRDGYTRNNGLVFHFGIWDVEILQQYFRHQTIAQQLLMDHPVKQMLVFDRQSN